MEKKKTNEETMKERIEKVENKLDVVLKSQATVMNAIGAMLCMSEVEKEDINMKNATIDNLLIFRDVCMEEVQGEKYKEFIKNTEKNIDRIKDILDKILFDE